MARLLEIPIKADLIKKSTNTYSINAESTGVYFKIDILKNREKFDLTDKTVRAYMLKKDKKVIYADCTLENNNDEIECFLDVTTQMLNAEYLTVQFLVTDKEGSTVVTNPLYIAIGDTVIDAESIESSNEFSALQQALTSINNLSSATSPLMANTVADMTDSTRCYVYCGSEEGYTAGYLYYWNGTEWTKGWSYQATQTNAENVLMADGTTAEATVNQLKEDLANVNGVTYAGETTTDTLEEKVDESVIGQEYLGGYIEVQPDSWDGEFCATDDTTKKWGFPYSLQASERERIKELIMAGKGTGIMYIRFPLGFAYRGFRNIDAETSLAKNIGERFTGQNATLKRWFEDISLAGGGLAPEYWCPAPYWVTSESYIGPNQLRAGGTYKATKTLASIKTTDETQYNAQIDAFTDAIVDDLEYLHQNIAPVRMFGLQNEPAYSTQPYGACEYDKQTYNDVMEVLVPKIRASEVLATYNDEPNEVKILVASSDENSPFTGIASTYITNHADDIWGYTHHSMRKASGEAGSKYGADWYKSTEFATIKGTKDNVFINEYEYFTTTYGTDEFRCSNNMLHMINELVYGGAKVLHPVIHICKPIGQTLSSTNTKGYCLFASNLNGDFGIDIDADKNDYGLAKGTVIPNKTMYNAWKLFSDNLPIGAYMLGSYSNKVDNVGYVIYKCNGKMYLFMANNSANVKSVKLTFNNAKEFEGKAYDIDNVGKQLRNLNGETIEFKIPAYSGQCWIETDIAIADIPVAGVSFADETKEIYTKQTYTPSYTITPRNAANKNVTFTSSDTSIATVSNTGVITGVAEGSATITIATEDGNYTDTVTITVSTNNNILNLSVGGINHSTGVDEDNSKKLRSDYIEVNNNQLSISSNIFATKDERISDGFVIRTYDESKSFLGSKPSVLTFEIGEQTKTYTYDSNVKYVRLVIANCTNGARRYNTKNGDIITLDGVDYIVAIS